MMEISKENTALILKNMRSETTVDNSRCEYIEMLQARIDDMDTQREWLLKEAKAIAENHPSKDARAFALAVIYFLSEAPHTEDETPGKA